MPGVSSSYEIGPPTMEDFNILKDAFIELAYSKGTRVNKVNGDDNSLYIKTSQIRLDLDFLAWPPYTVCLNGIIRTSTTGNSLVVRYSELSHNKTTNNSSLNHDYVLRTEYDELVEFGQCIKACPKINSPTTAIYTRNSDLLLDQVAEGTRILQQNTGSQLEISIGDCGVLFDRMVSLII